MDSNFRHTAKVANKSTGASRQRAAIPRIPIKIGNKVALVGNARLSSTSQITLMETKQITKYGAKPGVCQGPGKLEIRNPKLLKGLSWDCESSNFGFWVSDVGFSMIIASILRGVADSSARSPSGPARCPAHK